MDFCNIQRIHPLSVQLYSANFFVTFQYAVFSMQIELFKKRRRENR